MTRGLSMANIVSYRKVQKVLDLGLPNFLAHYSSLLTISSYHDVCRYRSTVWIQISIMPVVYLSVLLHVVVTKLIQQHDCTILCYEYQYATILLSYGIPYYRWYHTATIWYYYHTTTILLPYYYHTTTILTRTILPYCTTTTILPYILLYLGGGGAKS